jgi:hypothetical protein
VSAYRLIGYEPEIDYSFIEINRQIRRKHPEIVAEVLGRLRQTGSSVVIDEKTDLIFVNEEWTVSVVLSRHQETGAGTARGTDHEDRIHVFRGNEIKALIAFGKINSPTGISEQPGDIQFGKEVSFRMCKRLFWGHGIILFLAEFWQPLYPSL